MRRILLLSALALTLVGSQPTLADRRRPEDLNLTPQQSTALKAIRSRYEGRRQDLQLRLQGRRLELAKLLRQDDPEKAAVKAKLDEILALERERQQLFLDEIFEAKGELNAEQWGPFRQRVLRHLLQERRRGPRGPQSDDPTNP